MVENVPLQVIDDILLGYNIGDIFILLFGLSVVGALAVRSRKVLALQSGLFGLIFVLTPIGALSIAEGSLLSEPLAYKFLGLALLLAGPLLYATARQ